MLALLWNLEKDLCRVTMPHMALDPRVWIVIEMFASGHTLIEWNVLTCAFVYYKNHHSSSCSNPISQVSRSLSMCIGGAMCSTYHRCFEEKNAIQYLGRVGTRSHWRAFYVISFREGFLCNSSTAPLGFTMDNE